MELAAFTYIKSIAGSKYDIVLVLFIDHSFHFLVSRFVIIVKPVHM